MANTALTKFQHRKSDPFRSQAIAPNVAREFGLCSFIPAGECKEDELKDIVVVLFSNGRLLSQALGSIVGYFSAQYAAVC